tara:strand:+ start:3448 stop:3663 length:216 start_codon:yes stop_codon:yes gene_type:complete
MDIKTIATGIGVVISIASLFVFQGQLISRVDNLEKVTAPDTTIIEQDITEMKSDIAVLKNKIDKLENPLGR